MTEMETVLFGHERNGGGFIRETKETMEIVRAGQATQNAQTAELTKKVEQLCDKKAGWRRAVEVTLPALITAGLAFAAVMVAK